MTNMKIKAHESFCLRKGWLHKGIKNIELNNRLFTSNEINPCDILGVGSNMVKSMRYWLNATKIMIEENAGAVRIQRVSDIGAVINEYDRFYEEQGTNYIVHYLLSSNKEQATAWYWLFNVYEGSIIDKKIFFEEFSAYLKREFEYETTQKTYDDEFSCLMRTYCNKGEKDEDPEETKICPLTELKLVELANSKIKEYRLVEPSKDDLHPLIAYAIICDNLNGANEIKIDTIVNAPSNLGRTCNMDRSSVIYILDKIANYGYISISRTAGLDVINILQSYTLAECVIQYYRELNGEERQ